MIKFSELTYRRLTFRCLEECKDAVYTIPEDGFHVIQIYTDSEWLNVRHKCCNSGHSSSKYSKRCDMPKLDEIVVAYKKGSNIDFYLSNEISIPLIETLRSSCKK